MIHSAMGMKSRDDEVRAALKDEYDSGSLCEIGESEVVFGQLSEVYSVVGSKIDWARVPGSLVRFEEDAGSQSQSLIDFFNEMCEKFKLSGEVIYVGDSATDFALKGSLDVFRRVLSLLITVPQHHYFIGPEYSWCLCLTMEGDMAFGFSKRRLGSE